MILALLSVRRSHSLKNFSNPSGQPKVRSPANSRGRHAQAPFPSSARIRGMSFVAAAMKRPSPVSAERLIAALTR